MPSQARMYAVEMTDPVTGYIRVRTLCIFSNDDRILTVTYRDPTKGEDFWVPVGGQVEFGETAREAINREVREELSTEVTHLQLLGVIENLFTYDGGDGHEIVFVHDGRLADSSMYGKETLTAVESTGEMLEARWINPGEPDNGWPLYPEGLAELLTDHA